MKRRITSLFVVLCMLMAFIPNSTVLAASTFSGGTGTEDDPYLISSTADFIQLSTDVNGGNTYSERYFALTEDVTLTTEGGFVPIGTNSSPFNGVFDGQNHTVTLDIETQEDYGGAGIFAYINDSTVKNICTEGTVKATGLESYAGGVLAARGNSNPRIINCHNNAVITAEFAGGIVGEGNHMYIYNCSNSGKVTTTSPTGKAGGITSYGMYIYNCYNRGDVAFSGEGSFTGELGGIAGDTWNPVVLNCVNSGTVTDGGAIAGEAGGSSDHFENNYYAEGTAPVGIKIDPAGDEMIEDEEAKTKAVAKDYLFTKEGLVPLNVFVRDTEYTEPFYYWTITDGAISFTENEPDELPYGIINDASNYVTVNAFAKTGETVTITPKEMSYMTVTGVTVIDADDNVIDTVETEAGYTFTMPEYNVTITADTKINLAEESEDMYLINTADDMKILSKAVKNEYETSNKTFTLTSDLSLSSADGFEMIGSQRGYFNGTFDGQNHTITLALDVAGDYVGLFSCIGSCSTITNLNIAGSVKGKNYVGAVAGEAGWANISNCRNTATVTGTGDKVGGIAGYASNTDVKSCSNAGEITAKTSYAGGIVGDMFKNTVSNCYNSGTVTCVNNVEGISYSGGIVGYYNSGKVENCVNSGAVANGGALVGMLGNVEIDDWNHSYYISGTAPLGAKYNGAEALEDDIAVFMVATTEELYTEAGIKPLNIYAANNGCNLYWKVTEKDGVKALSLTDELPILPYTINNEAAEGVLSVVESADSRSTVTITVNVPEDHPYIVSVDNVTIRDRDDESVEVTKTDDNTYTFTMPDSEVYVDAEYTYREPEKDENGTYLIASAADLYLFNLIIDGGNKTANAKVIAEVIDATEYDISIGYNKTYRGTFDGNGATIITKDLLFSYVSDATIKNVNAQVTDGSRAGLVEFSNGNTLIDNCHVQATINDYYAGGIVYYAQSSTVITNCSAVVNGEVEYFGGIVCYAYDDAVIANCILHESNVAAYKYGGIVYAAEDNVKIYNCVNEDIVETYDYAGGIMYRISDDVTAENNFYVSDYISENETYINDFYDVCYDYNVGNRNGMTDKKSAVSIAEYEGLYIPAKLNEYIKANADSIDVALNKWSVYYGESETPLLCFADEEHKEIYSVIYTDITVEGAQYGAMAGDEVTVTAPDGANVAVTDMDGKEIELVDGVFTMPEGDVKATITMDTGIEETKEIDGKTYVVVKTGDDLVKAVTSIENGNNALNVYIAENIVLGEEEITAYPTLNDEAPEYNGIFDGNDKTITLGDDTYIVSMLGEYGVIKNLTVDGSITGMTAYVGANYGTIINCVNNADVTSESEAAGFAAMNYGTVINCINNGNISSGSAAAAICGMNMGRVIMCASAGEITSGVENASEFVVINNGSCNGCMSLGDSAKYVAADMNYVIESITTLSETMEEDDLYLLQFKQVGLTAEVVQQFKKWSADSETTLAFADEVNKPYYTFIAFGEEDAYREGETVTFTVDTSDIEEGFEVGDVIVSDFKYDRIPVTQDSENENTYSFTMPGRMCTAKMNAVPTSLEKETGDDGRVYYLINNVDDLVAFATAVNMGSAEINAKLTADIEDAYSGDYIGYRYIPYMGVFDGNGHSINLDMYGEYNEFYGLFGVLGTKAIVKNLTTKGNVELYNDEDDSFVGAIAGLNQGTIINCTNDAVVEGDYYVGGIAGKSVSVALVDWFTFIMASANDEEISGTGIISDCTNNADLSGYYVGGITGRIENGDSGLLMGENSATITGCENNGEISGYSLGGIVARAYGIEGNRVVISDCINHNNIEGYYECGGIVKETAYAIVDNCVNNGDVSVYAGEESVGENSGGIAGDSDIDTVIKNCVNNGHIYADDYDAGGVMGDAEDGTQIINCINNGDVSSVEYVGGIIGACSEDLLVQNCYSSGSVFGEKAVYAIACHESYEESDGDDEMGMMSLFSAEEDLSESKIVIRDTYYLQTDDVNADVASSNFPEEDDSSVAVTAESVASGEVSYNLNKSIEKLEVDTLNKWSVAEDKVIFADDDNGAVYKVTVDNIENGTVEVDGEYVKAGETVTITVSPYDGYELIRITGVDADENNSFVMPEEDVTIGAELLETWITSIYESEKTEDGKQIVKYNVIESEYVVVYAKYNDDNTLESIEIITDGSEIIAEPNSKVMIWSSLKDMQPLCESYEVK